MSNKYILDSNRDPIPASLSEWADWFENADDERIVAKTTIGNSDVSTVFLGLDHSFGSGPPLIYETLVFGGKLADEMNRYTTREQAEQGHREMCERVRTGNLEFRKPLVELKPPRHIVFTDE